MSWVKRLLLLLVLSICATAISAGHASAYTNSRLMDDGIFDNVNSMSEQQIRDFINSRPNSCLAQSGAIFPEPITYSQYGGNVDAARVIYNSARYSDVNPQVILATLQKEQTLITRTGCFDGSIDVRRKAMGQGCLEGGDCPTPTYAGFHQQVMKGTWQLGFNRHRAYGETGWGQNDNITYYGYMTRGNFKRCGSCSTVYYDGYAVLDGQNTYIENGATASLYSYTPHLGQSFPGIFEGWFGSTYVQSFHAAFAGQSSYPTISPGGQTAAFFKFRNDGGAAWYDDTSIGSAPPGNYPMHLATSQPVNRSSSFGSSWGGNRNRPTLGFSAVYESDGTTLSANQHVVSPNQIGVMSFTLSVPSTQGVGTYRESFTPVREGTADGGINDPGTYLDITVSQVYSDTVANLGPSPLLKPGQSITSSISYKNTGNGPWYDDLSVYGSPGANPVHLATSHSINRSSVFGSNWGPSHNRPNFVFSSVYQADGTTLTPNQHVVQPGQIGKYNITFDTPSQQAAGSYQEYFQPVVENTADGLLNDPGSFLTPVVSASAVGSDISNQGNLSMTPGQTKTITLRFTNVGNVAWTPSTTSLLANPSSSGPSFNNTDWTSSTVVTKVNEANVAVGQTGTFTFTLRAPLSSGSFNLEFAPSNDSTFFGSPPSRFNVNVSPPVFSDSFAGQSNYPSLMPGQQTTAYFNYRNTGNVAWYDDSSLSSAPSGTYAMHLATSNPVNRRSTFGSTWGPNQNRPAFNFSNVYESDGSTLSADQHVVQPGQIGRMSFTFSVPAGTPAGNYREYMTPVREGTPDGGMNNPGTYLDITVQSATYTDAFVGQSGYPTLSPGQSTTSYFSYRNTGNQTWYDDTSVGSAPSGSLPVHLATSNPINRRSLFGSTWGANQNRPAFNFSAVYEADGTTLAADQHVVQPGQIGKMSFSFTVPSGTHSGLYREYMTPVVEGTPTGALNDPGTYLEITVP